MGEKPQRERGRGLINDYQRGDVGLGRCRRPSRSPVASARRRNPAEECGSKPGWPSLVIPIIIMPLAIASTTTTTTARAVDDSPPRGPRVGPKLSQGCSGLRVCTRLSVSSWRDSKGPTSTGRDFLPGTARRRRKPSPLTQYNVLRQLSKDRPCEGLIQRRWIHRMHRVRSEGDGYITSHPQYFARLVPPSLRQVDPTCVIL